MRKVATSLGLGLALVSAMALLFWIEVVKLDKDALEREQASSLVEQENDELKRALEREKEKSAGLEEGANEVHRLRGEVSRLTRIAAEIDRIKTKLDLLEQENQSLSRDRDAGISSPSLTSGAEGEESNQVPELILMEDLVFRGNDTPEDALASFVSSYLLDFNVANVSELVVPELRAQVFETFGNMTEDMTDEEFERISNGLKMASEHITGVQVIGSTQLSDDTIQVEFIMKGIGAANAKWRADTGLGAMEDGDSEFLFEDPVMPPLKIRRIDGKWYIDLRDQ